MNRTFCVTILLAVIASNVTVGAHAATHVQNAPGECELCSAYNDPSDAVPASKSSLPQIAGFFCSSEYSETRTGTAVDIDVHQRGPPVTI